MTVPRVLEPPRLLDGRLKLRHLVMLDALAERGTVVGAAQHLHLTQPVVTRALRDIEAIIGVPLFDRGPRGITPTIFGDAFVRHARTVLSELHQTAQHLSDLAAADCGEVSVGTHLAGSNLLLPRAIAALKLSRPRLTVVVHEATPDVLLSDLMSGRVDLVVGRLTTLGDDLSIEQLPLYQEPMRVVSRAEHPATAMDSPTLADLLEFPWVLPVSQTAFRHELEQVFVSQGLALPEDRIECTSMLTLRQLLIETDVVAALPMLIASEDSKLALLPTPLEHVSRTVGLTVRSLQSLSPSTQTLLNELQSAADALRDVIAASNAATVCS